IHSPPERSKDRLGRTSPHTPNAMSSNGKYSHRCHGSLAPRLVASKTPPRVNKTIPTTNRADGGESFFSDITPPKVVSRSAARETSRTLRPTSAPIQRQPVNGRL